MIIVVIFIKGYFLGVTIVNKHEIQERIEQILYESDVGKIATVKNNIPYSRFMRFKNDGLTLYTATSTETDKAEDLEQNPNTHILLGYDGDGFGDDYVEYEGRVSMDTSNAMKKDMWNEYMEQWFDGPVDPNYVVLKIEPEHIQLMNKQGLEPKRLEFRSE